MSSIDLVILGMVLEKPRSAYELQKDVEYHHLSRWTKISVPTVYRKVVQLAEQGCLRTDKVKGARAAQKAVYSITEKGRARFEQLMGEYADRQVSFLLDFNVVVTNLNKLPQDKGLELLSRLRESITASARTDESYADEFREIPLVGRTVFAQHRLLYGALLQWLDTFEAQFRESRA